jgi:hypothetical protein
MDDDIACRVERGLVAERWRYVADEPAHDALRRP